MSSKSKTLKRSSRKRNPYSGSKTARPMARRPVDMRQDRQIKEIKKSVKQIKKGFEVKYMPIFVNIPANTSGSNVQQLNVGIAVGDTQVTRDGSQITATSLSFRGNIVSDPAKTTHSIVRLVVFWADMHLSGAPTVVGNTTTGTTAVFNNLNISTAPGWTVPVSIENIQLFDIIFDRTYVLNPNTVAGFTPATGATTGLSSYCVPVSFKKKFRRKIRFDSNGSGITDISTNSLWMALISDNNTSPPTISGMSRFCFKDN